VSGQTVGVVAQSAWTADIGAPRAELIPARWRGRTGLRARIAAHVLGELLEGARVDGSRLPIVYGSAHGEIGALAEMLAALHDGDRQRAHARFAGSLHGIVASHLCVATRNLGFCTTVTAGPRTVAMGLLEAIAALGVVADEIAVLFVEEAAPEPLVATSRYDALGAGVVLRAGSDAPRLLHDLSLRPSPSPSATMPAPVARNPCSPALALVSALSGVAQGPVVLEQVEADAGERRSRWCVDVHPG
jgi:hypothetical protein